MLKKEGKRRKENQIEKEKKKKKGKKENTSRRNHNCKSKISPQFESAIIRRPVFDISLFPHCHLLHQSLTMAVYHGFVSVAYHVTI